MTRLQTRLDDDSQAEAVGPVSRLCNEIKLFDLCELELCSFKSGNFCTNSQLINSFEKIAEIDERLAEGVECEALC